MMKVFLYIILFFATATGQEIYNIKSALDNVNEEIKSKNSYNREKWFYEQRIYPLGFIPKNAYLNAYQKKLELRFSKGYYLSSYNWVNIGPTPGFNQNYGNVSSRILSVKYDPNNPQVIYFGAAYGGVWKTTNGGESWFPKTDFEISLSSGAIAIDPNNTNIIYYGTGEATYSGVSYFGRGLLKSTDGGETWVNYRAGLPDMTYFSRLVIVPNKANVLFAALGIAGLYKSTNSGESWFQIISGRCDDIVFSPDGNKAYIIGQGSGYRISTNGGESFVTYEVFTLGSRNHLAICKSSPNILYASLYVGSDVYVYKSTNGGYNYSLLQNTFTGTNQAWYDFYIHVNPFDPNYAYIGLIDLWRTTNGRDFYKITNTSLGPVHVDHHNMEFHPNDPNKLIAATDGGLYYSTNKGTNWINLNATQTLTQFYRISSDPENSNHLIGGTQDNGTQRTIGDLRWNVVFGGDGGEVCFHSKNTKNVLGEYQFNDIMRSEDGGITWVSSTNGLSGNAAWIAPIVCHPDSANIFYTARNRIFKSYNKGATWSPISSGTYGTIQEMAISKSNPNIIYASAGSVLFKSTDCGYTFKNVITNLPDRIITSINIHPDSSDVILLTYSGFNTNHILKSSNGGNNWVNITSDLPDIPVNDGMFYYPGYSTSILLVATDIGVYISENYGANWIELANGLPNTVSIHLDFNPATKKIRIGTHGRGVWEFNGNLIGIINRYSPNAENYDLLQNYPNPFNEETIISFQIKEKQFVKLTIYDILGNEKITLINKLLEAGKYKVSFNGVNFPSGIYFYKIQTAKFSATRQMILIK